MADKKLYCIVARDDRPETKLQGQIEKGSGQSVLMGEPVRVLNKRCDIGLPNYTQMWGVRLDKNGNIPEKALDVKDPNYKGQLKELPWHDPNGYLIICRYLRGYNSIDRQYQNLVLGADQELDDNNEASADAYWILLQSGDNFFDPEADPYLCQMFRVHYLNGTSKFRDPEQSVSMFIELSDQPTTDTSASRQIDAKMEALQIVREVSVSSAKVEVLFNIVKDTIPDLPRQRDYYKTLQAIADENPFAFLEEVKKYRAVLEDTIHAATSFEILDLTKDGIIVATDGKKKQLIASDVPGKKDAMLDWVLANYLEPLSYEVGSKLKIITDKLKK